MVGRDAREGDRPSIGRGARVTGPRTVGLGARVVGRPSTVRGLKVIGHHSIARVARIDRGRTDRDGMTGQRDKFVRGRIARPSIVRADRARTVAATGRRGTNAALPARIRRAPSARQVPTRRSSSAKEKS